MEKEQCPDKPSYIKSRFLKILMIKEMGVLLALLAICTFTAILNPKFLSSFNFLIIIRQIAIFGIIAIGETFVIITGGIDLSPGSIVALSGIIVAWLIVNGFGIILSLIIVLLVAIAIGIYHGFFVSKLHVPPFVITLGTFAIARGLAAVITKGWPIINLPRNFNYIWEGFLFKIIPVPVVILLTVVIMSIFILNYTVLGRHIFAVGGNIEAARVSGINVDRVRIIVYAISSLFACIVGIMITARLSQGNPNTGQTYEMYAIASSVIGGTSLFGGEATLYGVLIGAAILSVIWNALVLLNVSAYWHQVALGIVLISAVVTDILRERKK